MPPPTLYEGHEVGFVIVGRPGPNEGGKTTNWRSCTSCNIEFLRRRSVIQQAIKHNRPPTETARGCITFITTTYMAQVATASH